MSILIKGVEMPQNCEECFALDERGDYPICRITQECRGYTFRVRKNRMEKCPLIEIQPHGRLIDVDEVLSYIDCGHLRSPNEVCWSDIAVVEMINARQTIIESESK